jgi:molybdopterin converting factor small subunit
MRITIECYGASQRWCAAERLDLDLNAPATVSDALNCLAQRYPELAARRETLAVAIGDQIVAANSPLSDGVRLGLIPPVSGG